MRFAAGARCLEEGRRSDEARRFAQEAGDGARCLHIVFLSLCDLNSDIAVVGRARNAFCSEEKKVIDGCMWENVTMPWVGKNGWHWTCVKATIGPDGSLTESWFGRYSESRNILVPLTQMPCRWHPDGEDGFQLVVPHLRICRQNPPWRPEAAKAGFTTVTQMMYHQQRRSFQAARKPSARPSR